MLDIYCDESGHLEHDEIKVMSIGGVAVEDEFRKEIYREVKEIKMKFNIPTHREIKWTKVSKGEIKYYKEIVDYFFNNSHLRFRAVVLPDKGKLHHELYNQTHDQFYYKVYYLMLKKIINAHHSSRVFIDIKDTNGVWKEKRLGEYLGNYAHVNPISVNQIRSHENSILQIADLLIGCVMYYNRKLSSSSAKYELSQYVAERANQALNQTSAYTEKKFNLLILDQL